MFNTLSDRLQMAVRRVTGRGRLSENDIDEMMKEIRLSLLEADVNYQVVKEFVAETKVAALDEKILKGLNPGQQVVKIVNDKLVELLGEAVPFHVTDKLDVYLFVGLQGAGKTTHVAKIANKLVKENSKKPLLVACDIYRPAAIEQLKTLGEQINCDVFSLEGEKPEVIAREALKYAKVNNYNAVLIDTAGRLHIDEDMMSEIKRIKEITKPVEIMLTVDAMTGQDAVQVAKSFHETLDVTGCIITKLDGDTRGGAALSIRKVTGVPIKFSGVGEKITDIEVFHGDRIASRILGMGDVMSLVEKVSDTIDEDEAMKLNEKMMSGKMNYNDMLKQFKMMNRMGSMQSILGMLPGMGNMSKALNNVDDSSFKMMEVIISSMTKDERRRPELIQKSSRRRQRIAKGSGRSVSDVNKLIKSLEQQMQVAKMMSNMQGGAKGLDMNQMQKLAGGMNQRKSRGKGRNKRRW